MKAPNGKPTKLNERQWVQVRPPLFKKLLGDWEALARIEAIENIAPAEIKFGSHLDKKAAELKSRKFGTLENIHDGQIAEFPVTSIGKITRNKGFDISRIIDELPQLYKESLLAWSEPEIKKEGHKFHSNIRKYHQYVTKFTDGKDEYY